MSQVLQIFRKDVRHLWIEIVASLAIVAAYTWQVIAHWGEREPVQGFWGVVEKALMVLVPVAWCLLVVRSIQGESLAGDRQFWVTRPYGWKMMLAAKLLFIAMFVHVPLFVVQVVMLDRSGFPAFHNVAGLLWAQLLVFISLDVPTAVVATITSSVVQVLIWAVGVVLYAAGFAALDSVIPNSEMPTSTDSSSMWSAGVFVAFGLAIILIQYAWRRTWLSRLLICGAGVVLLLIDVAMPYTTMVSRSYPLPVQGENPPLLIEALVSDALNGEKRETEENEKTVSLEFPIAASETEHGTATTVVGTLVAVQAPNGKRWSSGWKTRYWNFWPGHVNTAVPIDIDRKFFEQNKDTAVKVHISFATTAYRETNIREITAKPGEFSIEGVGICWVGRSSFLGSASLGCRAPFKQPSIMARVDSSASTCTPGPTDDPNLHESLYALNQDLDSADLGITPVRWLDLYFSRRNEFYVGKSPLGICPGTPFTVSTPEILQHSRVETQLEGVKLSDYLERQHRFSVR
jgi:hypothetical protein